MDRRPAVFHKKALEAFRSFPRSIRGALGSAILDLQEGQPPGMPASRPMPTVAAGAYELRVKDETGAYRAFYYLKFRDSVLVFHAFQKKTQKTPPIEIQIGKKRLKELLDEQSKISRRPDSR
jgi:phage-related protein